MQRFNERNLKMKIYLLIFLFGLLPMIFCMALNLFVLNYTLIMILITALCSVIAVSSYFMMKMLTKPINQYMHSIEQKMNDDQELANRTHEQAQALEEIVATIEEMNASIRETSANSEYANKISQGTLETVKVGEQATQDTLRAMREIFSSSEQIREIIAVVNDIASQTNLLAINAAVEAARAGEQGKGFAIVAAEIKNLAKRSAESAKEIEKLIKGSIDRVEKGNTVVQQAAGTLQQIVANTVKTSDVIAEVALAMHGQASATRQIEAALEQLNEITQENATKFSSGTSMERPDLFRIRPMKRLAKVNINL